MGDSKAALGKPHSAIMALEAGLPLLRMRLQIESETNDWCEEGKPLVPAVN